MTRISVCAEETSIYPPILGFYRLHSINSTICICIFNSPQRSLYMRIPQKPSDETLNEGQNRDNSMLN